MSCLTRRNIIILLTQQAVVHHVLNLAVYGRQGLVVLFDAIIGRFKDVAVQCLLQTAAHTQPLALVFINLLLRQAVVTIISVLTLATDDRF